VNCSILPDVALDGIDCSCKTRLKMRYNKWEMILADWIWRWANDFGLFFPFALSYFVVPPHIPSDPSVCMYIYLVSIEKGVGGEWRIYRSGREREGKWQNGRGGGYRTAQINIRHKAVGWLLLLPPSHRAADRVCSGTKGAAAARRSASRGTGEKKMVNRRRRRRRRTRQSMACKCSEFLPPPPKDPLVGK
jgi:hypothetical protein